ncbi:MAG TPA: signal peptidase I [Verrucomicrobiae bacterium]|nr:signal peptidase I [Verrucomicrobiae bacterium]
MGAIKAGTVSIPNLQIDTQQLRQFVFGPRPRRTLCRVLVWSVLTITFFHQLLVPIQIIGSSMSPTYRNGSLNLVNRWSYSKHTPHRGDVVALNAEGELLLKRIIALPGETVAIQDGAIEINGEPLSDGFSISRIPWEMDPVELGQNEFFVIGDNRASSVFCKVAKRDILGKTVF